MYSINGNPHQSFTATAQWTVNTYTITFNANGGNGGPSTQAKTHGQTLTLSTDTPTKAGYTFQGWSASSTATSAEYSAGGSYIDNSNITLYAVWKASGAVRIYTNNGWKQAIPYIYDGNNWKQAIPYIYDGNNWKIST